MRILDRYAARQLLPAWIWCLSIFVFLSCLIDLFEHLDEILRFHIPLPIIGQYYVNFMPLVLVHASPLALLFGAAFVAMRQSRYQELLAMNASGTSLQRACLPFVFVGWIASLCVFVVNDMVVPRTTIAYDRIRREAFRGRQSSETIDNVALMDAFNRLYHARTLKVPEQELQELTVLEHDWSNHPTKSVYASRAIWTRHGWLLLYGTINRLGPGGRPRGEPEPFMERLITYPVTPEQFTEPEAKPETMRYAQLRLLIARLKQSGKVSVRRYQVDLASKLTFPFMNLVVALIGFAGSTQLQQRGNLRGLGISLGWGMLYYLGVAIGQGIAKEVTFIPVLITVWAPHLGAIWWCLRILRQTR